MKTKRLRIVILGSPYDTLQDPLAQSLFAKTMALKIEGYRAEYPYGALPVETTDFIATHSILCDERDDGLIPLMAYRSVSHSCAKTFGLPFGGLAVVNSAGGVEHAKAIQGILNRCEASGREISYDSSWTINPEVRKDRELTAHLQEIMRAMHVLYHVDYNIPEIVAAGVVRFKMERYYRFWGYELIAKDGVPLGPIPLPFLRQESVLMFWLSKFSKEALEQAEKYRSLWNERIDICLKKSEKKAA
jgi:hypothetical protein